MFPGFAIAQGAYNTPAINVYLRVEQTALPPLKGPRVFNVRLSTLAISRNKVAIVVTKRFIFESNFNPRYLPVDFNSIIDSSIDTGRRVLTLFLVRMSALVFTTIELKP